MKTLLLMRHAKSTPAHSQLADIERPLHKHGMDITPRVAKELAQAGHRADVILASPAIRVQETLKLLQEHWGHDSEVRHEKSLYLAPPTAIKQHIESLDPEYSSVMVLGHNPGLSELASHLIGEFVEMSTASVAIFKAEVERWEGQLSRGLWRLEGLWHPAKLDPS